MSDETADFPKTTCLAATDKALQCKVDGRILWIPRSVVDDDSEVYDLGHHGKLLIEAWFARKERLL